MSLSDQIELAGSHMSWMHELRGPNGEWIHTAALNEVAVRKKVGEVKPGDAILAWNGKGLGPQQVVKVDKFSDGAVMIHVHDHDARADVKYMLDKDESARLVGSNGVPFANIRMIRAAQAKAQDVQDKLAAGQRRRDAERADRLLREPPRGEVDAGIENARKQLETDFASGIKSESKPHAKKSLMQEGGKANYFGNTADTQVVTFGNGHKWVRKRNLPISQKSNEYLASLVGRAIGAGSPYAFRHPEPDHDESQHTPGWSHDTTADPLWMQYVSGAKPAIEWMGGTDENEEPLGDNDPYEMMITPEGRKIGVLDDLTNNTDRHYGNWMVAKHKDGTEYPVPIDNGLAGNYVEGYPESGRGPFGESLEDEGYDGIGSIKAGEWGQMERNLKSLERDFEDEGRHEDFDAMMETFGQLRQNSLDYQN